MSLKKVLEKAWQAVEAAYKSRQINSEHCLQAVIYSSLKEQLDGTVWRVFVEPEMAPEGENSKFPDMVIVSGDEIRAIIELKFCPHYYANYREDIGKLLQFEHSLGASYPLDLDVYTGKYSDMRFRITSQTLYAFAVVAREDAEAVDINIGDVNSKLKLPGNFVYLVGKVTGREGELPVFTEVDMS